MVHLPSREVVEKQGCERNNPLQHGTGNLSLWRVEIAI